MRAVQSRAKEAALPLALARQLFSYDPETGILRCLKASNGGQFEPGRVAGSIGLQGYRAIKVRGKAYKAHRLAWLLSYGKWPDKLVDHINGIRDDNRLSNLRETSFSENAHSIGKPRNNTSGIKGVTKYGRWWRACIRKEDTSLYLGQFETKEQATIAYAEAASKLYGDKAAPSYDRLAHIPRKHRLKMVKPDKLTLEYVRSILSYEPETGNFIWLVGRDNNPPKIGDIAGHRNTRGYINIKILGKQYMGHRLAWFYTHSEWPNGQVDHINGNPSDNRILNLRIATPAQNRANAKLSRNNKIGLKGVSRSKKKWIAMIYRDYKPIILGRFDTPQEAHRAYVAAAHELHGEFARTE